MLRIDGDLGDGNESLRHLVGIQDGTFALEPLDDFDPSEANVIGQSMSVLMEACRLNDEAKK